jgi:hypothetical protein
VKPVTVQCGGRVAERERRQASVMEEVPLGFMRRILISLVDVPVTEGSGGADILEERGNEVSVETRREFQSSDWLEERGRASFINENHALALLPAGD